jgi:hypothetical protein
MQRRTTANVAAGSITVFSLFGWVGPKILAAAHIVHDAESLAEMMALVRGINVSWPGIYLFSTILGTGALLGINWDLTHALYYKRRNAKSRDWDCTVPHAINYIVVGSHFGSSLHLNDRYDKAAAAFYEAAKAGRIIVSGCLPNKASLERIPRRVWKKGALNCRIDPHRGIMNVELVKDDAILYTNMFVDELELESLWLRKPEGFF